MPTALDTNAKRALEVRSARFVAAKVSRARRLLRAVRDLPGFHVVAPFEVLAAFGRGLVVVQALGRPGVIVRGVLRDGLDVETYLLEPEVLVGGIVLAFAQQWRSDVVTTLGASGEVRQQLGRRRGAGHCERDGEYEDSRREEGLPKDVGLGWCDAVPRVHISGF